MLPWPYPDEGLWRPPPPVSGRDEADLALALAVVDRLRADRRLRGARIDVDAQLRVVLLAGHVAGEPARRIAGEICWSTPGVRDVRNTIEVR